MTSMIPAECVMQYRPHPFCRLGRTTGSTMKSMSAMWAPAICIRREGELVRGRMFTDADDGIEAGCGCDQ